MLNSKIKTVDDYINGYSGISKEILNKIRITIQNAAPEAIATIQYAIPTFVLNGALVHFAAFKNHIGFYALPTGNLKFQKEISKYKTGKGSIQFPLDEPIPYSLITKIVKYRVKENLAKPKNKKTK
ncbi:DUF1801 domain-containing protein [Leptospira sp. 96542]|nr:DUF1801 domain-containing protein [Leptospira sp. 96542]